MRASVPAPDFCNPSLLTSARPSVVVVPSATEMEEAPVLTSKVSGLP